MRRPTDKVLRGLACIATAAHVSLEDPRFKAIPEETKKDIRAAITWVRGMVRIKGRRSVARAMMDEQAGLYIKAPAYNPDWFTKKGYHSRKFKDDRCNHKTITDHVEDEKVDPKTWICSVCTKKFQWSDEASYYGKMECPKCGMAAIDAVCCSQDCRVKHRTEGS
jgi:hypothetical protein